MPSAASTSGGQRVTVHGHGFSALRDLVCSFGEARVFAALERSPNDSGEDAGEALVCVVPASMRTGLVPLRVASGLRSGLDAGGVPFEYVEGAKLAGVAPSVGGVRGGTVVAVTGAGFVGKQTVCRFGKAVGLGSEVVSDSLVRCTAPSHRAGVVSLQLQLDGQGLQGPGALFEFVRSEQVGHVVPSAGPEKGGTNVTVTGSHFVGTRRAVCKFGSREVAAEVQSSSMMVCESPAAPLGPVAVSVSTHGNGEYSETSGAFEYRAGLMVFEVRPSVGLADGGTTVTVIGGNMDERQRPTCVFGELAVAATVQSSSEAVCTSPGQSEGEMRFTMRSESDGEAGSQARFKYVKRGTVRGVAPTIGSVEGGLR